MVAPAIAAAGIGAVGSLVGGIAGGKGAKKAAQIQQQSAREQLAFQQRLYDQNAARFGVEIGSGDRAVARLDQLLGLAGNNPAEISAMLAATPGYQFTMEQAMRGVNASAHAKGLGNSGAAMKALQDRAANIASTRFDTHVGQVSSVADRGAQAKGALSGASQNFSALASGTMQNAANAGSNAALAGAANFQQMINGLAQAGGQIFGSMNGAKKSYDSSYGTPAPAGMLPPGFGPQRQPGFGQAVSPFGRA